MFDKLFRDHPASVDETYFEHMAVAASFGGRMFIASLACFVHALVPGLFVRTGSNAIRSLYERMVTHRHRGSAQAARTMQEIAVHGLSGDAI
ncbi:MAG TPA: DUF6356 family protein [Dongiaceae bacterium]|nr:DUF6356 family protein [Dongiaceae bacterium]